MECAPNAEHPIVRAAGRQPKNYSGNAPAPTKFQGYQSVIRLLQPGLPTREFKLLNFLMDATWGGWGRPSCSFTLGRLATSCNLSRRTVSRAQAGLLRRGLVQVQFDGAANTYTLPHPREIEMALGTKHTARQQGRMARQVSQDGPPGEPVCHPPIGTSDTPTGDDVGKRSLPFGEGSPVERVADAARRATDRGAERLRDKRAAARSKTGPAGLFITWDCAHRDAGLERPLPWPTKMLGPVKQLTTRWGSGGRTAQALHDLIEWAVQNWARVIRDEFGWMDNPPGTPDMAFLCRQVERFERAMNGRRQPQDVKDDPVHREWEDLMLAGRTVEAQALLERHGRGAKAN